MLPHPGRERGGETPLPVVMEIGIEADEVEITFQSIDTFLQVVAFYTLTLQIVPNNCIKSIFMETQHSHCSYTVVQIFSYNIYIYFTYLMQPMVQCILGVSWN